MYQYSNQERFVGPFLPFVGGLLVGGLFAPSKNSFYNSQPTPIYFQPVQYYPIATNYPYPTYYQNYPSNPQNTATNYQNYNANYQSYQPNPYYPD